MRRWYCITNFFVVFFRIGLLLDAFPFFKFFSKVVFPANSGHINFFLVNASFLYPLKKSETYGFFNGSSTDVLLPEITIFPGAVKNVEKTVARQSKLFQEFFPGKSRIDIPDFFFFFHKQHCL